jgi:hypothetical protein
MAAEATLRLLCPAYAVAAPSSGQSGHQREREESSADVVRPHRIWRWHLLLSPHNHPTHAHARTQDPYHLAVDDEVVLALSHTKSPTQLLQEHGNRHVTRQSSLSRYCGGGGVAEELPPVIVMILP